MKEACNLCGPIVDAVIVSDEIEDKKETSIRTIAIKRGEMEEECADKICLPLLKVLSTFNINRE